MKSNTLKQKLRKCALDFAERRDLSVDTSHSLALIFAKISDNFHPESFANIAKHSDWKTRLIKIHQNVPDVLEMQSSNSSDALLMNIFCHPLISKWTGVKKLLRNDLKSITFGFPGEIRINNGQVDKTEIDMALSDTFCEAKLTETDFTLNRPGIAGDFIL